MDLNERLTRVFKTNARDACGRFTSPDNEGGACDTGGGGGSDAVSGEKLVRSRQDASKTKSPAVDGLEKQSLQSNKLNVHSDEYGDGDVAVYTGKIKSGANKGKWVAAVGGSMTLGRDLSSKEMFASEKDLGDSMKEFLRDGATVNEDDLWKKFKAQM